LSFGRVAMVDAQQGKRQRALAAFEKGRAIIGRLKAGLRRTTPPCRRTSFGSRLASRSSLPLAIPCPSRPPPSRTAAAGWGGDGSAKANANSICVDMQRTPASLQSALQLGRPCTFVPSVGAAAIDVVDGARSRHRSAIECSS
jgi:hypothetical protein